ncbi:AMIN domain-containing protein [Desulfococcaceae bacterium HSG8]|nr:AMIN domain-containing protein [Desulfococcaceae bacterium HSG8]
MECPKCASEKVTYSHRRGLEKIFRYFWPSVPYRCKECWTRFWKFRSPLKSIAQIIGSILIIGLIAAGTWYAMSSEDQDNIAKSTSSPEKTGDQKAASGKEPIRKTIPKEKEPVRKTVPKEKEPVRKTVPKEKKDGKKEKPSEKKDLAKSQAGGNQGKVRSGQPVKRAEDRQKRAETPRGKEGPRVLKKMRSEASQGAFTLFIPSDGPIRDYKSFTLAQIPPKVVIDLVGKWKYTGKTALRMDSDIVWRVRVGEHADKLRVVMDLKGKKTLIPVIEESSEGLVVKLKK